MLLDCGVQQYYMLAMEREYRGRWIANLGGREHGAALTTILHAP
jgi:hypothetical protein